MDRWKRAVVNLELRANSNEYHKERKQRDEMSLKYSNGEITSEDFYRLDFNRIDPNGITCFGTGIWIDHKGHNFLVTARHVLFDEISADHMLKEAEEWATHLPIEKRALHMENERKRVETTVYRHITRLPSLDEVARGNTDPGFLLNLVESREVLFSPPEIDLAIISLDAVIPNNRFTPGLSANGYSPIPSSDILDEPSAEGAELFAIGFPALTNLSQLPPDQYSPTWNSGIFSLPATSFGRVAMLHSALHFFWADMSIYPGNSGGPVVEGDRLVGIASAVATHQLDNKEQTQMLLPSARVIKARYVLELLEAQYESDMVFKNLLNQ